MSEIAHKIWGGSINVQITLADVKEEPLFLRVYRNSYLPLLFPLIAVYFRLAETNCMWLEFEEAPLKWNLPVGLLFDLVTGLDPLKPRTETVWELKLHTKDYPIEYIIPLEKDVITTIKGLWFNQMKESCYVSNGNAKKIMNLSKNDSEQLWQCVVSHDFKLYTKIWTEKVLEYELKHIPVRIYLPLDNVVLQEVVEPELTLGELLHRDVREFFHSPTDDSLAFAAAHGIVVPMKCAVVELFKNISYLDGFLHLNVVVRQ